MRPLARRAGAQDLGCAGSSDNGRGEMARAKRSALDAKLWKRWRARRPSAWRGRRGKERDRPSEIDPSTSAPEAPIRPTHRRRAGRPTTAARKGRQRPRYRRRHPSARASQSGSLLVAGIGSRRRARPRAVGVKRSGRRTGWPGLPRGQRGQGNDGCGRRSAAKRGWRRQERRCAEEQLWEAAAALLRDGVRRRRGRDEANKRHKGGGGREVVSTAVASFVVCFGSRRAVAWPGRKRAQGRSRVDRRGRSHGLAPPHTRAGAQNSLASSLCRTCRWIVHRLLGAGVPSLTRCITPLTTNELKLAGARPRASPPEGETSNARCDRQTIATRSSPAFDCQRGWAQPPRGRYQLPLSACGLPDASGTVIGDELPRIALAGEGEELRQRDGAHGRPCV